MWWVGCHGGAGTTTLAGLTGMGADGGTSWPTSQTHEPTVVLVCRATASGVLSAIGAVQQWKRATPRDVTGLLDVGSLRARLLGVAAVAATPRRTPRIAAERLRLLSGWVPAVWRIGWIEELLAADEPQSVGMPPDVDGLRHAVQAAIERTGTR